LPFLDFKERPEVPAFLFLPQAFIGIKGQKGRGLPIGSAGDAEDRPGEFPKLILLLPILDVTEKGPEVNAG